MGGGTDIGGHALVLVIPLGCVTWASHLTSLVKGEMEDWTRASVHRLSD